MGEMLPLFTPIFNRGLAIESQPERLTGDAGAVLLREILERAGIVPCLVGRLADRRRADLVTYPLDALLRTVLFGQGWRDQDDADALRFDPALRLPWRVSAARSPWRTAATFRPSRRCRACSTS